jgi:outer membrane protein TolC
VARKIGFLLLACAVLPTAGQAAAAAESVAGAPAPATDAALLPDPSRAYTLPELIDLAQKRNPTTRIAWNAARQASSAVGIAEASYLPRLSAIVAGGGSTSDGRVGLGPVAVDDNRSVSGVVAVASLQWLLFDFGGRAAVVEAAKQDAAAADIAFNEAHQRLMHAVTLAYLEAMAARDRQAISDGLVANAQGVEAAARHKLARGIGTAAEAAQAAVLVAEAKFYRARAEGAVARADAALLAAMGMPPSGRIRLAEPDARALPATPPPLADEILEEALRRRLDIQRSTAIQKAADAREAAAQAQFYPKLFVSGTGAFNSGQLGISGLPGIGDQQPVVNVQDERLGASIFAGLSIPLYDGGARRNLTAQAQAGRDLAGARAEQARNEAIREIIDAHHMLKISLSAHAQALAMEKAAAVSRDAALMAFRTNMGSLVEVQLAENAVARARAAVSDARHAAHAAAATLALVAGQL